eukprot:4976159-Pyramimonas_sp.AAC.1
MRSLWASRTAPGALIGLFSEPSGALWTPVSPSWGPPGVCGGTSWKLLGPSGSGFEGLLGRRRYRTGPGSKWWKFPLHEGNG